MVQWYFYYILIFLNLVFVAAFFIQRKADADFILKVSALMEE